ncbi:hypothetical protein DSO57_1039422 [Entomophthora muscae]|uniref:Uncharacterized protein n=1 Tax=Entomophthora muscae TaxID=34485 RepID=A0ACC2SYR9_9FUNG|nr:hypothetical protein DSO57_1039422 [Entomophthora muscae]
MKGTAITTLALASHGLAFDFGSFIPRRLREFRTQVPGLAGAGALVPKNHFTPPTSLTPSSLETTRATLNETEFNLVSTVMNTIVVVDFNRKKLLPLDLVDAELPLNPNPSKPSRSA